MGIAKIALVQLYNLRIFYNYKELQSSPAGGGGGMRRISSQTRMKLLNSANPAATVTGAETHASSLDSMRKVSSSSSLSTLSKSLLLDPSYLTITRALIKLCN